MKNKNYIWHMPDLRNSITYDHDFWCTCVKWCYLQGFFQFFKILIFQVVRGIKGQKLVQNDKNFCLSCFISQESYIWFSFMVQICKMLISPGVFFSFKILIFRGFRVLKGQKWPKMTKNLCHTFYFRNHISFIYGTHVCIKR